jgi:hypothetical protein
MLAAMIRINARWQVAKGNGPQARLIRGGDISGRAKGAPFEKAHLV